MKEEAAADGKNEEKRKNEHGEEIFSQGDKQRGETCKSEMIPSAMETSYHGGHVFAICHNNVGHGSYNTKLEMQGNDKRSGKI